MTIPELHRLFLKSTGISTDSRKIIPGSIYFALKGERFDGNDFAIDSLAKGCIYAVVDRPEVNGDKIISVGSALDTLQQLATYHRTQTDIKILAITGSNGKTTTKELIASILSTKHKVMFTRGNLNNHIGVPLTLLEIKDEAIGVIEMGANHSGEIATLADIARPDFGLITNIGKAHLEGFGSLEGVLKAKGELYQDLAQRGKKAFLNRSDEMLSGFVAHLEIEVIPYNDEHLHGEIEEVYPLLKCKILEDSKEYAVSTQLVGAYNVENIVAAFAVGNYFAVPVHDIIYAIETYVPQIKRSQLITGKRNTILMDAYNANPTSMRESVSDFLEYTDRPKLAILGDMLELGQDEEKEHADLIQWLLDKSLQQVIFVGRSFEKAGRNHPEFLYFTNVEACNVYLDKLKPSGWHILIKGSRKLSLEATMIHLID